MTDDATEAKTEFSDLERELMHGYVKGVKDRRLYLLAQPFADHEGRGTYVNLLVGGTIICGQLCSGKEWTDALNTATEASTGKPFDVFTEWGEEFAEAGAAQETAVQKADSEMTDDDHRAFWSYTEFIFLLDAYILENGVKIPTNGQPYRVRLDQVQAWGLGTLASAPAE